MVIVQVAAESVMEGQDDTLGLFPSSVNIMGQ
jgi:hypothetical protein